MAFLRSRKSFRLSTLLFSLVVDALLANTFRLQSQQFRDFQEKGLNQRKIIYLQVQFMDRIFTRQQEAHADQLLYHSEKWLAPLRDRINSDPALVALIKEVGFVRSDVEGGVEVIDIDCNPVTDDPDPYEQFTFTFSGDKCIGISRKALCLW